MGSSERPAAPVVVVVGNPKPRSRTSTVAEAVARKASLAAGLNAEMPPRVIELADLAAELFNYSSPQVAEAADAVRQAELAVVASPTYKATYTGLLKAFLDRFSQTDLAGVVAIPVMVGALDGHALATEVHLRPVLVEIGASLPTRGFYVCEGDLDGLEQLVDSWVETARSALIRSLKGFAKHPAEEDASRSASWSDLDGNERRAGPNGRRPPTPPIVRTPLARD